jgi:DNA polymerase I
MKKLTYNPYTEWYQEHIEDLNGLKRMINFFKQDNPKAGGFDTETDGLHIIHSKPFLIQFGWLVPKQPAGKVFTFYPTRENMKVFLDLAKELTFFIAHNIKFDLHMLSNIGYGKEIRMTNLVENMVVARLALEAIPARDGGDSLALKSLGEAYVHSEAGKSERLIKEGLEEANLNRIKILSAALKQFPIEGQMTATGRQKYWGKGAIEKFLKDPTQDVEDLPIDVREVWEEWQEEYPEATYEDIDRPLMIKYGAQDVITMLEFFKKAYPYVMNRKQEPVLRRESNVILPLYKMERQGIRVDRDYLLFSRTKVKNYIIELRNRLYSLVGEVVTVNQHARIKELFSEKWGIKLEKSDKKAIKDVMDDQVEEEFILGDGIPDDAKEFAKLIKALRTLEKWYSTYINRVLDSSAKDGRAYTQLHQNSAVSGRMSSDFQQFPKDGLYDLEGNELYHPRKAFLVDENKEIAYLDYSQVELRSQADYTIKVSGGDLNLCRAYMPFKCHRIENGITIPYDFQTIDGRREWNKYKWYLNESPETEWHPTDVHGQTTHNALLLLGYECKTMYKEYVFKGTFTLDKPFVPHIHEKEYGLIRGKGKTFNFMKNYGGGLGAAMKQLNLTREVAQALIDGYSKAFPHVMTYQKMVERQHGKQGYVTNTYGRRYYLRDASKSYKLGNYLIQGSCADALKQAIVLVDEYIVAHNLKTSMLMPIHDEIQFSLPAEERHHLLEFKRIMEEVFESWCLVPIVADMEITTTNWKEKEEYEAA